MTLSLRPARGHYGLHKANRCAPSFSLGQRLKLGHDSRNGDACRAGRHAECHQLRVAEKGGRRRRRDFWRFGRQHCGQIHPYIYREGSDVSNVPLTLAEGIHGPDCGAHAQWKRTHTGSSRRQTVKNSRLPRPRGPKPSGGNGDMYLIFESCSTRLEQRSSPSGSRRPRTPPCGRSSQPNEIIIPTP